MRPAIELDAAILRQNAAAWRAHAGAALRAVVKANGYGWGFAPLVRAVEPMVDGFVVADIEEFIRVRALTTRPIAVLADVVPSELGRVLDAGGVPNVSSRQALEAATAWTRRARRRALVRVGLRSAAGWAGLEADELGALAPALAAAALDVELWSHLTDPSAYADQRAAFLAAEQLLREAGVRVVRTDVESSIPLAAGPSGSSGVRVGVGLFGFRLGGGPEGLRGAISVRAPIVETVEARGQLVGYGTARAPRGGRLVVVRCGYADGFPAGTWPELGILSVGMQYTVIYSSHSGEGVRGEDVKLLGAQTDVDTFVAAAGIRPHEFVVRLGHGRRADHSAPLEGPG